MIDYINPLHQLHCKRSARRSYNGLKAGMFSLLRGEWSLGDAFNWEQCPCCVPMPHVGAPGSPELHRESSLEGKFVIFLFSRSYFFPSLTYNFRAIPKEFTPQTLKLGSSRRHWGASPSSRTRWDFMEPWDFSRAAEREKVFQAVLAMWGGFLWKVTAGLIV